MPFKKKCSNFRFPLINVTYMLYGVSGIQHFDDALSILYGYYWHFLLLFGAGQGQALQR